MSIDTTLLVPKFNDLLQRAIEVTERNHGVNMIPYCGERDVWEQARYWRRSRPTWQINQKVQYLRDHNAHFLADTLEDVGPQTGPWATNAFPGQSWHQWGEACDLYWDINGDEPGGAEWSDLSGYRTFAKVAKNLGLTAGFFWDSRDAVHVQLRALARPGGSITAIDDAMKRRFRQ